MHIIDASARSSAPISSESDAEERRNIFIRRAFGRSPNGGLLYDKQKRARQGCADDAAGDAGGDFDRSGVREHPHAHGAEHYVQHDPGCDCGHCHGPARRDDRGRGLRPDQLFAVLRDFRHQRAGRRPCEREPRADVHPAVCEPAAGGRAGGAGLQGHVQNEGADLRARGRDRFLGGILQHAVLHDAAGAFLREHGETGRADCGEGRADVHHYLGRDQRRC